MRRSFFIFALILGHLTGPAAAEPITLTILHTNDLQDKLLPAPHYDAGERGGLARILHLLQRESENHATLILDGGDALGAAALSRFDAGRTMAELMAQADYAAMATGNPASRAHPAGADRGGRAHRPVAARFQCIATSSWATASNPLPIQPS